MALSQLLEPFLYMANKKVTTRRHFCSWPTNSSNLRPASTLGLTFYAAAKKGLTAFNFVNSQRNRSVKTDLSSPAKKKRKVEPPILPEEGYTVHGVLMEDAKSYRWDWVVTIGRDFPKELPQDQQHAFTHVEWQLATQEKEASPEQKQMEGTLEDIVHDLV